MYLHLVKRTNESKSHARSKSTCFTKDVEPKHSCDLVFTKKDAWEIDKDHLEAFVIEDQTVNYQARRMLMI